MRSADARIGGKDIGAPEAPSTEPPTSTVASKSDAQKLAFSCARSGADCYGPCARHAEIVFAGELCLNAEMRAAFATGSTEYLRSILVSVGVSVAISVAVAI